MLKLVTTNQFEKDFDRMIKRGKDKEKLFQLMQMILNQETLEEKFRDHLLKGPLVGRRECHIESDWLLIYKLEEQQLIFERMGTHSDLFKK